MFLFGVYLSGEIYVWQAVGFVGFYLFFVGVVFWMDLGTETAATVAKGNECSDDVESGEAVRRSVKGKAVFGHFEQVKTFLCLLRFSLALYL